MAEPLFRAEAVAHRTDASVGRPTFVAPPGSSLVTLLMMTLAVAALAFLFTGDYARKTTVTGYVEPAGALKRVYAPGNATVDAMLVRPGDRVDKDQPIAYLTIADTTDEQDRQLAIREFDNQLDGVDKRLREALARYDADKTRITSDVLHQKNALARIERMIGIQFEKVAELQQTCDAAAPLYESGRLSRIEWGRFHDSLLTARQAAEELEAQREERRERIRQLTIEQRRLAANHSAATVALQQEASRLKQSRDSLEGASAYTVPAPAAGRVATVMARRGQRISAHQPIASVTPEGTPLVARLLVPSRSIGFVTPGLAVNLLYDAFPYQQFGTYRGAVVSISSHALLPGETTSDLPMQEPFFEVVASLQSPWVDAYGERVRLRSGMSLRADIVLDRRTLIDWVLEPLYVLRGRSG